MAVSRRIKELRKRNGLTQLELAEHIGVSAMTERRWEWGQRSPRAAELAKLAEALHTTVAYLMGIEDNPEPVSRSEIPNNSPKPDLPESNVRGVVGRVIELPIYTLVACMGDGIDNEGEPREKTGTAWLDEKVVGPLGPIKPYLIFVEGTSMEPKIYDGDRLLINENVMPGDGDVCLARFSRSGYLRDVIKYYFSTYDGGFILKSSETSGIPAMKISRQQAIEREAFVVGRAMYIDRGEKI